LGAARLLAGFDARARIARIIGQSYGALVVGLLLIVMTVLSLVVVKDWPTASAESDEGMSRETRPVVANLPQDSLLVSAVTRGVRDSNSSVEYLDLIDYGLREGDSAASLARFTSKVEQAMSEGRAVYYLYSQWEAGYDFEGGSRGRYRSYFDAAQQRFSTAEVFQTSRSRLSQTPWILYELKSKAP
jgi:hypothetical protein